MPRDEPEACLPGARVAKSLRQRSRRRTEAPGAGRRPREESLAASVVITGPTDQRATNRSRVNKRSVLTRAHVFAVATGDVSVVTATVYFVV